MSNNLNSSCTICEQGFLSPAQGIFCDYISKHEFILYKCSICGSYITQINPEDLQTDYYGDDYYNSEKGKFSFVAEKIFRFDQQRRAKYFYSMLQPKAVLDVGCGRGYFLEALQLLGSQVYGLESEDAPAWILENPRITVKNLPSNIDVNWPFENEYFDLIIFWHVLEHMPDPNKALENARRVLKPNKIICISVPNSASFQATINLSSWFHLDVPRHRFHFSKKGLIALLEKQHYEVIRVTSGGIVQNLYGWWQSLANLFTHGNINSFYRLLQGGKKLREMPLTPLFIQVVTSILWLPAGLVGYIMELLSGNHGVITVWARKRD